MTIYQDIIDRAIADLTSAPVKKPWTHGPFCPWCALAGAKGAIEKEEGLDWTALDGLLSIAALAVKGDKERVYTQSEALTILQQARET